MFRVFKGNRGTCPDCASFRRNPETTAREIVSTDYTLVTSGRRQVFFGMTLSEAETE